VLNPSPDGDPPDSPSRKRVGLTVLVVMDPRRVTGDRRGVQRVDPAAAPSRRCLNARGLEHPSAGQRRRYEHRPRPRRPQRTQERRAGIPCRGSDPRCRAHQTVVVPRPPAGFPNRRKRMNADPTGGASHRSGSALAADAHLSDGDHSPQSRPSKLHRSAAGCHKIFCLKKESFSNMSMRCRFTAWAVRARDRGQVLLMRVPLCTRACAMREAAAARVGAPSCSSAPTSPATGSWTMYW